MSKHTTEMTVALTGRRQRAPERSASRLGRLVLLTGCACALLAVTAGSSRAATPGPAFTIDSFAQPQNFSPTADSACTPTVDGTANSLTDFCNEYQVTVINAGSEPTNGSPITITDTLPAGLTPIVPAYPASLYWSAGGGGGGVGGFADYGYLCTMSGQTVTCTVPFTLAPDAMLEMYVFATVKPGQTDDVTNTATVSGGGAPTVSTSSTNPISSSPAAFGATLTNSITGVDGQPDTQAGDHPYELSTRIDLNTITGENEQGLIGLADAGNPKDIVIDLPLGFMGSALAAPQCTFAQLAFRPDDNGGITGCPPDTQVGEILPEGFFALTPLSSYVPNPGYGVPIFNMTPENGVTAEFGFQDPLGNAHVLDAQVVPSPSGYVLQVSADDISEPTIADITTTFFGDPAAKDGSGNTPVANFTMPSECDGQPLVTTAYIDSWQNPGQFNADGTPDLSAGGWVKMTSSSPPVTGCNLLHFSSSLSVQPDTTVADSPSGVDVNISVPQSETPGSLATPPLENGSVTLPPGFTVNPSSAAGLQACTPAEIDLSSASPPTCPQASQVGTAQLQTPLIAGTLQGEIYLASEFNNPSDSLLAGYIVVNDPTTGVVVKIPGSFQLNQSTGQITGVFDQNPQFPFSDLNLDFKGGPTGVLATPEDCGTFTATSVFSPWSFPDSGPASTPNSNPFSITSGCVSGFKPTFTAGTQNAQAGAYSPFVLSMSRSDTDENFQGLSVTLPPGMLAKLAGVSECSESQLASISSEPGTAGPQIANPSCPANSQVGKVETGAGTGPDPFFLGGKVYLTGPYKGAPYGLAVVVPVVAGPLDLGTVVVRQALYGNTTTAQVTDVSDPFPTILDGIPLQIRTVSVTMNRPDFTVNPTSCNPMAITGTLTSTGGLSANVSSRFQVGGCQDLGFSPKLKIALTGRGKTRSGDHPTLTATLTDPAGQANIRSAKVALPLSLALDPNNSQHVCNYYTAQAVTTGPAGCPTSTIVGQATADTPLLSQPLTGPVYLVQGIRFSQGQPIHTLPSLLIPLRGQIALDLRAQSSVSGGKLVTTFATIPDAPVSKFTLTINGGKHGILVITGRGRNICTGPQVTDATLTGQNTDSVSSAITMSTPCKAVKHRKSRQHKATKHKKHAPLQELADMAMWRDM